jgi:branched-chain amino acid transport system permease protein
LEINSFFQYLVSLLVSGITIGAIYATIALGFVTIFRSSSIINFAQGEFVMLGGILTVFFLKVLNLSYFLAGVFSVCIVTLVGLMVYRLVIHPLRKASVLVLIMSTLGVSIFITNTTMLVLGNTPKSLPAISTAEAIKIGRIAISPQSIWVIGMTILILIILYVLSNHTLVGKAMEASSTAPLAADLVGIPTNSMVLYSFGVSAAVGAIGGIFITPIFFIRYDSGGMLGLKGFIAAVIGGWGSPTGAVLGGFLLGILESLSVCFISAGYKNAVSFVAMILILYFKPTGVLGSKSIERF